MPTKTHAKPSIDEMRANAPTLRDLIGAAADRVAAHEPPILDGDFDTHPYVDGLVDLAHEVQKQPWHEWDDDVARDWIRSELKKRVFGDV